MPGDAELLIGAQQHDRESVAALYDRHAPRMYAVALRILGDSAAAAAVIETTFASICAGDLRHDEGAGTPASWLIRQARDHSLARQAQTGLSSVDLGESPTPRLLVEAAFYGGMSVAALAERSGMPEDQVRAMLREGMTELRKQFGEHR
jgi:RNA polymerase sigma-70 factor (ECF subfamily)